MGAGVIIAKSRLDGFHETQDLSNNLERRPLLARNGHPEAVATCPLLGGRAEIIADFQDDRF
jgi:hypothetical protein